MQTFRVKLTTADQARSNTLNEEQLDQRRLQLAIEVIDDGIINQCEAGYTEYTTPSIDLKNHMMNKLSALLKESGYTATTIYCDPLGNDVWTAKFRISWGEK